ncbi:hypothetical protein KY285_026802 [Solanum tuberosum]|nr:hypothetical protein KY285_026802 [Solanum tuberosum]
MPQPSSLISHLSSLNFRSQLVSQLSSLISQSQLVVRFSWLLAEYSVARKSHSHRRSPLLLSALLATRKSKMTQIGSRVSENGASNESIPNTSSPNNEVEVDSDTSKKENSRNLELPVGSILTSSLMKVELRKPNATYCAKSYAASTSSNGTSSMNTHMRICPKFPHDTVDKGQNLLNFLPSSMGAKEGVINTWKFEAQSRRALAKMIIVDELSFSFVKKEGFKNFMRVTVPQFHIPYRRTVTRDCYELYCEERQLLKKVYKESRPRVCLTTDTWTSIQKINCIHKGGDMAACITNCLLEWGLDNVFTITVDNASSNDVTVKEVSKQLSNWGTNIMDGDHLHVRCMEHILNLIVQDGLKEIGEDGTSAKDGTSADILTSVDWKNVRSMVKFLETFYVLTLKLRSEPFPINIEEDLEYLEQLELDFACSGTESSNIDI